MGPVTVSPALDCACADLSIAHPCETGTRRQLHEAPSIAVVQTVKRLVVSHDKCPTFDTRVAAAMKGEKHDAPSNAPLNSARRFIFFAYMFVIPMSLDVQIGQDKNGNAFRSRTFSSFVPALHFSDHLITWELRPECVRPQADCCGRPPSEVDYAYRSPG